MAMQINDYAGMAPGIMSGEPDAIANVGVDLGLNLAMRTVGKVVAQEVKPVVTSVVEEVASPVVYNGRLLPGEGNVGTYRDLIDAGVRGDNLHHMPANSYMNQYGVGKNDGVSMDMEQPSPGVGGRHLQTATYGLNGEPLNEYLALDPRDALARDLRDARRIYMQDGLYTSSIKKSLLDVSEMNKVLYLKKLADSIPQCIPMQPIG